MPRRLLTVPYYSQGPDPYCGPASADMVLAAIDGTVESLDRLYSRIKNASHVEEGMTCDDGTFKKWSSAPDGLAAAITDLSPSALERPFRICSLDSDQALTRRVIWSIYRDHAQNIPQVVLVYGVQHWLVVEGYDTSDDPKGADDGSYTINAIFFKDPDGEEHGHVICSVWGRKWVGRVCGTSHWAPYSLALCSSDGIEQPPPQSPRPCPPPRHRNSALVEAQVAIDAAVLGLKEHGLTEIPVWNRAIDGAFPRGGDGDASAGTLLVQRLDMRDEFYHLVPFVREARVTLRVIVDAMTGEYNAGAIAAADAPVAMLNRPEAALDLCVDRTLTLPDGDVLVPRREAATVHKLLIWQPCLESMTPFRPFYVVTVGQTRLYVRIDGQVFTELHTNVAGR